MGERSKQIKEKEKRVRTITTTFLISDLFPNFVSLPSLLSPKNYTASSKELRRLLIGRLFDKRTMDGNTHALRVRRTCEQKRRRTS